MIISFDIDDTLIPLSSEFELENSSILPSIITHAKLRKGTYSLFKRLESEGHEIWIYTTSLRSIFKLKLIFWLNGLYPSRIINGDINCRTLRKVNCAASKNPKAFGIDIHIDDSEGVKLESKKYNFHCITINPNDQKWAKKVLLYIDFHLS